MTRPAPDRPLKSIPVSAAEKIAKLYGYDQVVIIARRVGEEHEPHGEHVTTYGRDPAHCAVAARMGDVLKYKIMGWPPTDAPSIPDGFALVPEKCTNYQYEAMKVFAEVMMETVGKLDLWLIYSCGVRAFETDRINATLQEPQP